MHLVTVPTLLGGGERLFEQGDAGSAGYECAEMVCSPSVTHTRFVRSEP